MYEFTSSKNLPYSFKTCTVRSSQLPFAKYTKCLKDPSSIVEQKSGNKGDKNSPMHERIKDFKTTEEYKDAVKKGRERVTSQMILSDDALFEIGVSSAKNKFMNITVIDADDECELFSVTSSKATISFTYITMRHHPRVEIRAEKKIASRTLVYVYDVNNTFLKSYKVVKNFEFMKEKRDWYTFMKTRNGVYSSGRSTDGTRHQHYLLKFEENY
ncbi:hypothetical protein 4 [Drosophila-associated adintovirus 3]|uniref:Uncharacterized protein n=1 Tax=Drosophila-associated adintovirus 3 TaxID=2744818 RepID=A0A7D4VV78_9VIRU|nr:hypothetical protein 4 [Drosophila-associated adintovirus 3]